MEKGKDSATMSEKLPSKCFLYAGSWSAQDVKKSLQLALQKGGPRDTSITIAAQPAVTENLWMLWIHFL